MLDALVPYEPTGATYFILINEGIASNLIARFILDLRSVYRQADILTTQQTTTIRFADAFAGNLAVDSVWVAGAVAGVADDRWARESEDLASDST
ncbi:hypothetical protein EUX98_g8345 [Antrodiella citrinella]|uniref:Uncharacterized protein n=1 Tax=Antrodiella citrinella TaxID=2447956 RepID=A0A4S4M8X5_9APHY|nr:hypothetical protein EUX98_g8345 [Antrodiella citrinella]